MVFILTKVSIDPSSPKYGHNAILKTTVGYIIDETVWDRIPLDTASPNATNANSPPNQKVKKSY